MYISRTCPECDTYWKKNPKQFKFPRAGVDLYQCPDCKILKITDNFDELKPKEQKALVASEETGDLLSKTSEYLEDKFNKQYKVLVWGESVTNPDKSKESKKRLEILNNLKTKNEIEPFFSEGNIPKGVNASLAETVHVKLANFIICIGSSWGPLGEIHELILGQKKYALVWLKEGARHGFTGSGIARILRASGTAVEFYNDETLDICALATVSIKWVENMVNLDKYLAERGEQIQSARA